MKGFVKVGKVCQDRKGLSRYAGFVKVGRVLSKYSVFVKV